MAKCKLCRKDIADGTEYCNDCIDKKDLKDNETYLDSLLNSVQGATSNTSDIYKKKNDDSNGNVPIDKPLSISMEIDDLDDFDQFDITEDLDDPIVISNEDLYGDEDTSNNENNLEIEENIDTEFLDTDNSIPHSDHKETGLDTDIVDIINHIDMSPEDTDEFAEEENTLEEDSVDKDTLEMDYLKEDFLEEDSVGDITENIFKEFDLEESNEEYNTDENKAYDIFALLGNDEEEFEDDISALLGKAEEELGDDISALLGNDEEDLDETDSTLVVEDEQMNSDISPENELLNLLNQFKPENPMDNDIQAISDLLGGIDEKNKKKAEHPEDVGEVFHEALGAVTDLDDPDHGIQKLSQDIDPSLDIPLKDSLSQGRKKKKGFFARVFGNIEYDEADLRKMEAKEAADQAKKSKRKMKKNESKLATEPDETGEITDNGQAKALSKAEAKAQAKAKAKAEKKKAKQAKKELRKIKVIDETVDEDKGRINPLGASIVFAFFGLVVVLFLVSTHLFSYSLSVKNATNYFEGKKYNQAYNEVYGIEIKDEDIELYDKIMTVMYVNKQLNSYNNYYHMRKYPEALDSLLKGLERYDKYVELATLLGIKTDLDYVRNQMVAELYSVFSLTEEEAIDILNSENQLQYSIAVYDVVLENILVMN